jgi:DNA-directed RNA polymerase specialized sigma24 family protein
MAVDLPPHADTTAVARAVDRHLEAVYGFVARRLEDRVAAVAVTWATFQRGWALLLAGDVDEAAIGETLHRIAASAVTDHARRELKAIPAHVRARDLDEDGDREAAEDLADEAAMRAFAATVDGEALRRALLRLSGLQRRAILLRYLDGLEPGEMAGAAGSSSQDLGVETHRALRALHLAINTAAADVA